MTQSISYQHPDITKTMWNEIDNIIQEYKNKSGSLIATLRECQNVVGYLPVELLDYISDELNIARSRVFGVATFYSLFSMKPKGRHNVRVCMGTACYVKGIKEVVARITNEYNINMDETTPDKRFSFESVRCLGACGLAPVALIDNDTYGDINPERMLKLLEQYK
ncbi:NADH-quinone oxidoreductase subunit E [Candidatus Magnetomoraceae bacterium gMMP-1]